MKKVVITGSNGQLGWELQQQIPDNVEVYPLSRQQLDVSDSDAVDRVLSDIKPTAIINAAAYTAVDQAESDQQNAQNINTKAVEYLVDYCTVHKTFLVQVSTDFIFDGNHHSPIDTEAKPNPLSVYGKTKYEAERAITSCLDPDQFAIIRTAWVYSCHGGNFVKSMLRLMKDKPQLGIVSDQIGTPTWAKSLASICWQSSLDAISGVYHWTDAGVASWYDFAVAIQRIGLEQGLLERSIPIHAIKAQAYPTPAQRPAFSYLDKQKTLQNFKIEHHIHWQDQLVEMMRTLEIN